MNGFVKITEKLPPLNVEVETFDFPVVKKDILIKIEWINQMVVYTWMSGKQHTLWRNIK